MSDFSQIFTPQNSGLLNTVELPSDDLEAEVGDTIGLKVGDADPLPRRVAKIETFARVFLKPVSE